MAGGERSMRDNTGVAILWRDAHETQRERPGEKETSREKRKALKKEKTERKTDIWIEGKSVRTTG